MSRRIRIMGRAGATTGRKQEGGGKMAQRMVGTEGEDFSDAMNTMQMAVRAGNHKSD